MKPRNIFHTIIVVAGLCLTWMIPFNSYSAEIYISPLVVNIGQSFSFHVTTKNLVELKSYTLSLHLPLETVSQVSTIDPVGDEYSTFTVESYFDTNLESVVWNISATMKQPVYGDRTLFRVNAKAADRGGYSDIGMAAISGELTSAFVHGGSIYVLDPTWPWYDVQINYQNAFHRLDVDGSGLVDPKDIFLFSSAWHQNYQTNLPDSPDPTPTPVNPTPTPTPISHPIPTITEFVGIWTFDCLHNTLVGLNIHHIFDAELNADGAILLQGRFKTTFLGTYTYDESTGKISGVFMINDTNPLNAVTNLDYFVNFEGEATAGNSIAGEVQFTYNTTDIQIAGYESYGLTITDTGNFVATHK